MAPSDECGTIHWTFVVLVADDDSVTLAMVSAWLKGAGYEVIAASDGDDALALAREHDVDLLLLDVTMPGRDGYEICRAIQAESVAPPPPVIFLTAHSHTDARVAGLDAGAVDYIVKPFANEELVARVRAALRTKAAHDELVKTAARDGLTGLFNRRELDARATQGVALAQRHGRPFSCLLLDLDHFKQVNDTYGTPWGTPSCARLRAGSAARCGSPTPSVATGARSSSSCCPRPTASRRWRRPTSCARGWRRGRSPSARRASRSA